MKLGTQVAESIVRRHLDSVWAGDWGAFEMTCADNGHFSVVSGDIEHKYPRAQITGIYRFISQAWDWLPGSIDLRAVDADNVEVVMTLTHGGRDGKRVPGKYHVNDGKIDHIELVDCPIGNLH